MAYHKKGILKNNTVSSGNSYMLKYTITYVNTSLLNHEIIAEM